MFSVHEDTVEETLQNLMEHSTGTLYISDDSDDESELHSMAFINSLLAYARKPRRGRKISLLNAWQSCWRPPRWSARAPNESTPPRRRPRSGGVHAARR